jgi:hypothetical protein
VVTAQKKLAIFLAYLWPQQKTNAAAFKPKRNSLRLAYWITAPQAVTTPW